MGRAWLFLGGLAVAAGQVGSQAGVLTLPNASFESPVTPFVNPQIDSWQKTAKPSWYDESGGFLWEQLTGLFKNTPATSPDHLDNCDGAQAIWLFAVPEVGLFQDYDSVDWNDPEPSREFDVRFEPGYAYQLTVGVLGGGGNMTEGASLELSLYYRDNAGNVVTVATTPIIHSPAQFSTAGHLLDFQVQTSVVTSADPCAGRHLGVRLLSTVDLALQGGYWDVDNLRLRSIRAPLLTEAGWTNGQFGMILLGEPGQVCEILAQPALADASPSWTLLQTVTNQTGSTVIVDPAPDRPARFYQARWVP